MCQQNSLRFEAQLLFEVSQAAVNDRPLRDFSFDDKPTRGWRKTHLRISIDRKNKNIIKVLFPSVWAPPRSYFYSKKNTPGSYKK